jgi:hypothetical protein
MSKIKRLRSDHRAWGGLLAVLALAASAAVFMATPTASAATSPTLVGSSTYSALAGAGVTCTGPTTTSGAVGVSPGTAISGFPIPCVAGGGTHSNDASAIAAQADNLVVFGALDQSCDQSFGAVDLTVTFPSGVGPGVYCSTSSFSLSGNLNLTGSGVWIFKTVSTLITSPGSSVTGGDPCNVWWRIGSSVTLDTTTSFIGNILALNGVNAMNTGATLNGRILVQDAGTLTLDSNTISGPVCAAPPTTTLAPPTTTLAPPTTTLAPPTTTLAPPTTTLAPAATTTTAPPTTTTLAPGTPAPPGYPGTSGPGTPGSPGVPTAPPAPPVAGPPLFTG